MQSIKEFIDSLDQHLKKTISELDSLLVTLPNIPHASVPEGKSAEDNRVHKAWDKELPLLPAGSVPHWDLAEKYNLIDFKLGAFISGSGFPYSGVKVHACKGHWSTIFWTRRVMQDLKKSNLLY